MGKYLDNWKKSINEPAKFWGEVAKKIDWYKPFTRILDDSNPPFYKWFVGGVTNTCYNAVDRWALGKKRARAAYIWESPETGQSRTITYFELYREVNRFASALMKAGIGKGDRVIIYMPMTPEACISALACTRIGAIHSIVFAGFSYDALANRIDDSQCKAVICADGGSRAGKRVELKNIVDKAIEAAQTKVNLVIVHNRNLASHQMTAGRDVYLDEFLKQNAERYIECEHVESTEPCYILYTSGTTGKPKGVVRDTGGHMVALYHSMFSLYGCTDDDIYMSTSDIGWVVGHSYIIYGPLLAGLTSVIYEGTPVHPDPSVWFRVIEKYGVNIVFSSPTAFRMLRKFDEKYIRLRDLSTLRTIFLAGEPLDEPTWIWATSVTGKKPILDHYWQTETGWAILSNPWGTENIKIKRGSPTFPMWGWNLEVVDENGEAVEPGTKGYLVATPPTPPGVMLTLWG